MASSVRLRDAQRGLASRRRRYFAGAVNTEAFFSFMGGMINKRSSWDRVGFNQEFDGTCWAHVARLFELMNLGLRLRYVPEYWQNRRPDNDSFMRHGLVARMGLSIDGYHTIADTFFGRRSIEAFHVRRVLRNEVTPGVLMHGKFMCLIDPEHENIWSMHQIAVKAYGDLSRANINALLRDFLTPATELRNLAPEVAAQAEAKTYRRPATAAEQ